MQVAKFKPVPLITIFFLVYCLTGLHCVVWLGLQKNYSRHIQLWSNCGWMYLCIQVRLFLFSACYSNSAVDTARLGGWGGKYMYKVSTKSLRRLCKKKRNMMYSIPSLHVPTCMYQVKIFCELCNEVFRQHICEDISNKNYCSEVLS